MDIIIGLVLLPEEKFMVRITMSNICDVEKEYVIEYVFGTLLGLKYSINYRSGSSFIIENCDRSIVMTDSFESEYLRNPTIPQRPIWLHCRNYTKGDIPFIYGNGSLLVMDGVVNCGVDIFNSVFFMLSRWEEMFLQPDEFGRCDEERMFVVRNGIYMRPLVNEYVDFLCYLLQKIGVSASVKRSFHPFITHDIDDLFRYASLKNFCKNLVGDIFHRKNALVFFTTIYNFILYMVGKIKDPFDTFDYLMDISDAYGFHDAFYFIPSLNSDKESSYDITDKRVKAIVDNIISRGHEVGFHPSMNTFGNNTQFALELNRLKLLCGKILGGRQHYLMYKVPDSLEMWDMSGLIYDAGLGFSKRAGFRCGICYDFPFFDVKSRKQLKLVIRPLIFMDKAVLPPERMEEINNVQQGLYKLIDTVYSYGGEFVMLWHNDHLKRFEFKPCAYIYSNLLEYMHNKLILTKI